jgi:hypothetical protein
LPDTFDEDANFGNDFNASATLGKADDESDSKLDQEPMEEDSLPQQDLSPVSSPEKTPEPESPVKSLSDISSEAESPVKPTSPLKAVDVRATVVTPIKTPEPSSVFKSFFTSNVSIEELEREIEASQKARLEEDQKTSLSISATSHLSTATSQLKVIEPFLGVDCEPMSDVSFTSTVSVPEETAPSVDKQRHMSTNDSEQSAPESVAKDIHSVEPSADLTVTVDESVNKPKEKKRFSLADYKKRREIEGIRVQQTSESSVSSRHDEGPGTPTLDEELASLAAPPTLNTLPLFEKLEKLEKAQKESKSKGNYLSHGQL